MNAILLKEKLSPNELYRLLTEFPQYKLVIAKNDDMSTLTSDQATQIEILYGSHLSPAEIAYVPQLKWVHVPGPYVEGLCMEDIQQRGNILVSTTKEENLEQIGEFAMSALLAFAKNLFHWHDADASSFLENAEAWKKSMWTPQTRIFLQIGLGLTGTEIARRARQMGFTVWGIQDPPSFHPHCHKVLSRKDLHSLLPAVDAVCLSLPRDRPSSSWFRKPEMALMKADSVLLVLGQGSVLNFEDLAAPEILTKLRGVVLDARFPHEIPSESPLWKSRHVLITPEIASYPQTGGGQPLRMFLYNLRQFLHGNFSDMKNLVSQNVPLRSEIFTVDEL